MKAFKSIGFETELFLTEKKGNETLIYNADKTITDLLGFSIDSRYNLGNIKLGHDFYLFTDGTPIELTALCPNVSISGYFINCIKNQLEHIKKIEKSVLFEQLEINWDAFFRKSDLVRFCMPGKVFASQKEMINAYTNEARFVDKKEEDKNVTVRTAGLHIHFELNKIGTIDNRYITNKIIVALDELYFNHFNSLDFQSNGYIDRQGLQKKGDYRIKWHPSGVKTLEYRQLTTKMLQTTMLYGFVCAADEIVANILRN